ncbi:hypothetical protein ACSFBM_17340 [Variovorax sp. GB1R11]|uniref:hypothetical protein n=1 Tax=Variovorax sp. GB1R11 TaxID=3443741 RepID=UPI003F459BC1
MTTPTATYITVDYDKVGNRTHVHTRLRDHSLDVRLNENLVEQESDRYFRYDAMNRQTVVNARSADGQDLGPEGHRIQYNANGNRESDTHAGVRIVEQGGEGSGQRAVGDAERRDHRALRLRQPEPALK